MDGGTKIWLFQKIKKVAIKEIPVNGLFLHRKQVWRSLGKLNPQGHSVTAQRVLRNEHDTEICMENADFTEHLLVKPYEGEVPTSSKTHGHSMSYWQNKSINV